LIHACEKCPSVGNDELVIECPIWSVKPKRLFEVLVIHPAVYNTIVAYIRTWDIARVGVGG